jgi:hypothetical protein
VCPRPRSALKPKAVMLVRSGSSRLLLIGVGIFGFGHTTTFRAPRTKKLDRPISFCDRQRPAQFFLSRAELAYGASLCTCVGRIMCWLSASGYCWPHFSCSSQPGSHSARTARRASATTLCPSRSLVRSTPAFSPARHTVIDHPRMTMPVPILSTPRFSDGQPVGTRMRAIPRRLRSRRFPIS